MMLDQSPMLPCPNASQAVQSLHIIIQGLVGVVVAWLAASRVHKDRQDKRRWSMLKRGCPWMFEDGGEALNAKQGKQKANK